MRSTLWVTMLSCVLLPFSMNGAARTEFNYKLKGCVRESADQVVCRVAIIHRAGKSAQYPPKSRAAATLSVVGGEGLRSHDFDIEAPNGKSGLVGAVLNGRTTYEILWYFRGVPADSTQADFMVDKKDLGPVTIQGGAEKPGANRRR